MFWFAGLCRFWAIFGVSGGPFHRICYQKPTYKNEHNSHGHFLMFDVYGPNLPHKALATCVHLFSLIFWGCLRNHIFCWSILYQNTEKCGWRWGWLFWRNMQNRQKAAKRQFWWSILDGYTSMSEHKTALKCRKSLLEMFSFWHGRLRLSFSKIGKNGGFFKEALPIASSRR